jgi:hypothetical protein
VQRRETVTVSVHDILGRETIVIADACYDPGLHYLSWTAPVQERMLAPGMYLVSAQTASQSTTRKLLLLGDR